MADKLDLSDQTLEVKVQEIDLRDGAAIRVVQVEETLAGMEFGLGAGAAR